MPPRLLDRWRSARLYGSARQSALNESFEDADSDEMRSLRDRPGLFIWLVTVVGLGGLIAATVVGPGSTLVWEAPIVLFWLVVITASLCVLAAVGVIVVAHRDATAEIGILGGALFALSMFGLVHGIALPGVLFDQNGAVTTAALMALPAAVMIASPLLFVRSAVSRAVSRHWRPWVVAWSVVVVATSALLLARPDLLVLPGARTPVAVSVAALSLVLVLMVSFRQLRLYWVGELRATLVGAIAFAFIGLTAIVWIGEQPFSAGFWLVHLLDISGVLGACAAVAFGHRAERRVTDVLGPILERDPLAALELGLAPVVRRFVAALGEKDEQTRDHVVRVGETATRVGERLRLTPRRLRYLGLAAILHDVGKLAVDDAILQKPGPLTGPEYDRIKRHAADGEQLLLVTPELAPAARFVRSHHERVDGMGYPDGLVADQIPLEARIIAACDAYDAIANTRYYRDGLGGGGAASVLQEHAGSQWDARVVATMLPVIADIGEIGRAFERVGRGEVEHGCDSCLDALPAEVRELLLVRGG